MLKNHLEAPLKPSIGVNHGRNAPVIESNDKSVQYKIKIYSFPSHIPQFGETLFGISIIASYTRFTALQRELGDTTMEFFFVKAPPIDRVKQVL
jgi:hypothetical protein